MRYDYVIVGAGSAGCVLAGRLSEKASTSVLLLEAGGKDAAQEVRIPAAFAKLFKTPVDWAYFTEEEAGCDGRKLYWPRGKMLGGCSSINAMIYMRGSPLDYDGWRDAGGAGWGWSEVLPFFRKAEDQQRGPSELHGVGGPLRVEDRRYTNPLSHAFVEAGVELGYARNDDFNGPGQDGFGLYQVNQRRGRRHSTVDGYLRPALRRPNLTVETGAHVHRVRFDHDRAVAVEYRRNGSTVVVEAEREVLLCAGAIGSPHILMLSGVGPADALRAHELPVIADVPAVGENLQDHPSVGLQYACMRPISLARAEAIANIARFLLFGRGMLTSNIAEAGGFIRTDRSMPAPDIQFHFAPAYFINHGFERPDGHGFAIGPTLVAPRSRGRITLRSTDPIAPPRIAPHYFSEPEDLAAMLAGLKVGRQLANSKAFSGLRGTELMPGGAVTSDTDLLRFIAARSETLYHPAGTCRMGASGASVVDPELRVRGVSALRVVDASVMPAIVRGNTNAPTIMIAEKAAAMLGA